MNCASGALFSTCGTARADMQRWREPPLPRLFFASFSFVRLTRAKQQCVMGKKKKKSSYLKHVHVEEHPILNCTLIRWAAHRTHHKEESGRNNVGFRDSLLCRDLYLPPEKKREKPSAYVFGSLYSLCCVPPAPVSRPLAFSSCSVAN